MSRVLHVIPDVDRSEFAAGLDRFARMRGKQVMHRIAHANGAVFPELSRAIAEFADASGGQVDAWTFFESPRLDACNPQVSLHVHSTAPAAWQPSMLCALARIFGGWGLGLLSDRYREVYAFAACQSGVWIEGAAWESGAPGWRVGSTSAQASAAPGENGVWSALTASCAALNGGSAPDLRWSDAMVVHSWLVARDAADDGPPEPSCGARLRRSALLDVDAATVSAMLPAFDAGAIRFGARLAPVTGAPCVVLDGAFEPDRFVALARALGVPGVTVELEGMGGTFDWCEVGASGARRDGCGRGLNALVDVGAGLAIMIGEPPAIIRLPDDR